MRSKQTVTLPSGAIVEMQALTIAEENILASAQAQHQNQALDDVLSSCTCAVLDPGPYPHLPMPVAWADLLQADRFSALLNLRMLSFPEGDLYIVGLTCPSCANRFDFEINLVEDLVVVELSDDGKTKINTNQPFEVTIDGKKVKFNLPLGKTALRFEALKRENPGRNMACSMRSRIVEVEGLKAHQILDWLDGGDPKKARKEGAEALSSADAEVLRDAFDAADCGVDSDISAYCPSCGHAWTVGLPFDRAFFLPGRGRSQRKKERHRGKES